MPTTRDRQIEERKEAWRRDRGRKKVPGLEAERIAGRLPPTTLFSVLWRLRRRSDYEDASAFVQGVGSADDAEQYQDAITTLVHSTLAMVETVVVEYVGPIGYVEAADSFLRQASGPGADALTDRRRALGTRPQA